mgnify:FL=1
MFLKAMKPRSILKFAVLTGGVLCLVFVSVLAGAFLFLQTDTGRATLASQISRLLSSKPGMTTTVEGLEGLIPFNIGVRRVVLADGEGPWLTVKDIRIDWSPATLLHGRVYVGNVSASTVNLDRAPKSAPSGDSERHAPPSLPTRIPPVTVERISIGEFNLGELVAGRAASFRVDGGLKAGEGEHGAAASLSLARSDGGPETRLQLILSSPVNPPAVRLRAEFHEGPEGWVASTLGIKEGGGMEFTLDGDGLLTAWEGSLHGTVPKFGTLESSFAVHASDEGFEVKSSGHAGELLRREEKPFPLESVDWAFDIGLPTGKPVAVRSLRVEAAGYIARVNGSVDLTALNADLQTALLVKNGKSEGKGDEAGADGAVKLAEFGMLLHGNKQEGSAKGTVEGRLMQLERISKELLPFLGPRCTVNGSFEFSKESRLLIPNLKVESERLNFTARADANVSGKTGRVEWRLAAPKLDPIGAAFSVAATGSLEAEGTVEGSFSDPQCDTTLRASGLGLQGRKVGDVSAAIGVRDVLKEPRGNIRIDLRRDGQTLQASSGFSLKDGKAEFSAVSLKAPGADISGNLAVQTHKTTLTGSLKGEFPDLSSLGRLLGEPLGGSASLDLKLDPGTGGQTVKARLKGSGISSRYGSIKTASLSVDLSGLPDVPSGHAEFHLDGYQGRGIQVQSLDFKTSGDRRGMDFEGSANGKSDVKFKAGTRGTAVLSKDILRIRLKDFKGKVGKQSFALLGPAAFQRTAEGYTIEDVALGIGAGAGAGQLKASGRLTSRDVSFTGQFDRISLGLIRTFGGPSMAGQAAGRIDLEGNPSRPTGSFTLTVANLFYPTVAEEGLRSAVFSCNGKVGNGRLAIGFDIARGGAKPVTGRLGIPLTISLAPAAFSIPSGGPLDGRVEARVDLASLTTMLPIEGHKFTGTLSGTIELGGTVAEPMMGGQASIAHGTYENFALGTVLKDVRAEIAGKGNHIAVEKFEASDGEKGTVSARGSVTVAAANRFPMEVRASISSAKLVRRPDAGVVADGNVSLSGPLNDLSLSGNIRLESAEYDIPKRRPAPIASLKVTEIHGPGPPPPARETGPAEDGGTGEGPPPFALNLDVGIGLPGKAFLRGEGLDSEWKGEIHVSGPAASPSLSGQISVVRGTFQFLGQRFNLVQGNIQFDGATPPNPLLDVTAQIQANDIKANVILSGVVSSPDIRLESEPSLPPDEILSRILFKRSLTQINPAQALKIAAALGGLSGQGSAFDFLDRTRGFLGLDQLELREPESAQNQVAVGIGKYLTDQVYVDVQKDVGSGGATAAIQVEIAPNLTLGSNVGTDADKGIEINWKRDY